MLLTRDGRFNSDAFYTEAQHLSQDNAYNNALLTQIKNALKTNFNIDERSLAKWEKKYKSSHTLPKDAIAKKAKTSAAPPTASVNDQTKPTSADTNPPIQDKQAAGAGQNPQAAEAQDTAAQTQPNTLDELAKQEHIKMTKTIQEIQQLNFRPMGTDNMLVAASRNVDINNQRYVISCFYPNFEQLDKLINLKSRYSSTFDVPENLIDLVKSGKIKSISPGIIIRHNKSDGPVVTVVKGVFNT